MKIFASSIRFARRIVSAVAVVSVAATVFSEPSNEVRKANTLGPADAPVTIDFFADLQCPQCARYEPIVKNLKIEFGDKVRMVLRHCPLNTHQHAELAACAAEAAANQGKFWQMVDSLYKTQWMWANAPAPRIMIIDQAKNLGLDIDQFQKDWDGPECHDRIDADEAYAQAHGVKTAPSVLINGYNVPNAEFSENGIRAAIKAALAKPGR